MEMPKTTSKEEAVLKKMDANPNAPRYVSCDLTPAQKLELNEFIAGGMTEDLWQWLIGTVMSGHVVTMKTLDVGYQCSVTGAAAHGAHANKCLISRSSTPERAVWSVHFKDSVVLKSVWPVTNRLEELD
jgi:hypothetical protein